MLSISLKAEDDLIERLTAIKTGRNADGSCCLHIRGLALGDRLYSQLPPLLGKWIGDPLGKILVCEDRDIFVFSNLLNSKFYGRFKDMLFAQLGYEPKAENTVTAFYDHKVDAAALDALIKSKLEKKQTEEALKEEKRKLAALNARINAELLASLPARRASRKHFQILVIEDDPFSRRMISLALSPEFEAVFSESGMGGLYDYLRVAPDIVFLDINLPDISGHEVLRKIMKYDSEAHIVILSGNGHAENVMTSVNEGAKGFVGKPFAREKIYQFIQKAPRYWEKKKEI